MFKKSLLTVLLALGLVAFLVTESPALLRTIIGGSYTDPTDPTCDCYSWTSLPPCTLCGKCVEGYVRLVSLGNVDNVPTYVLLTIFVQGEGDVLPSWAVICGNPGTQNWTAPGINIAYLEAAFGGIETIDPANVLKNGTAYATVPAVPTEAMLTALADLACPNPNWIAWDALPCSNTHAVFEEIIYVDGACYLRSSLTYNNCYIDGCPGNVNWTWDDINQTFTFVPTPYTCPEEPVLNTWKTPEMILCPEGIPQ